MDRQRVARVAAVILLVVSGAELAVAFVTAERLDAGRWADDDATPEPGDELVVVTTQSAKDGTGRIVAVDRDERVVYHDDSAASYWDVDRKPGTRYTVEYVASYPAPQAARCSGCSLNVLEQVNLSTGERRELFSGIAHRRWHDADRIAPDRFVVADIAEDTVFVANTTSGMIEWTWRADGALDYGTGHSMSDEWTHLNDVEQVGSDVFMVSLRNQDRVVFVDRSRGLRRDRTLGAEDDYDVLNEQHNPDYIPASRGGPAILVADSDNSRIVEYQRTTDGWERTWVFDRGLFWPRDADRLPGGNTMITGSNSDRVIEVNRTGDVVWSLRINRPYESEVLTTPPESGGGEAASRLGLESVETAESTRSGSLLVQVRSGLIHLFPTAVVNAVLFVQPGWMSFLEVAFAGVFLVTALAIGCAELYWRYDVRFARPVAIRRRE